MAFVWGYAPNGRDMGVGIQATYSVPGGGSITWQTASVDVSFQISYYTTYPTMDTYNVLHWWGAASGSAENTFYWSSSRTAPKDGVGLRTVTVSVPLKTGESQNISLGARLEGVNTAGGNMSVTASITIPARPYGTSDASLNVSSATLGSTSVVVTITKKASQMRHTVYWRVGSGSWNWLASNVDTSYTWTPPLTVANSIPNAASAAGEILVETYENGQHVGGVQKALTFAVPASIVPTAGTFVASEGNSSVATIMGTSTTAETKTYVQGQSSIKMTYSGETGSYGSTITRVEFSMGGLSVANIGSGTKTTVFTNSPASNVSIIKKVTDSRGRTASTTLSGYYVRAYNSPKIASFSVVRAIDTAGTEGNSGVYGKVKLVASGSSLLNGTTEKNTLTWRLRSKVAGSPTWESDKWAGSDSTADANQLLTPPTSYVVPLATGTYQTTSAYEFELAVWDKFTVNSPSISLHSMPTEIVPLSISKEGIGVGKIWEQGALDVRGDVYVSGQIFSGGGSGQVNLNDLIGTRTSNLNFAPAASGGSIGLRFDSAVNPGSDFGEIRWYDDNDTYARWGNSGENGALVLRVGDDADTSVSDVIALESSAGIFLNSPKIYQGTGNRILHEGIMQIARGEATLSSSEWTGVSFGRTFPGTPTVVLTANTTNSGSIVGKVRSVTTTGFEGTIGGTGAASVFNWIAIWN